MRTRIGKKGLLPVRSRARAYTRQWPMRDEGEHKNLPPSLENENERLENETQVGIGCVEMAQNFYPSLLLYPVRERVYANLFYAGRIRAGARPPSRRKLS